MKVNFGEKLLDLANLLILGSIIGPIWFERFKVVFALVMFLAGVGAWIFLYLSREE